MKGVIYARYSSDNQRDTDGQKGSGYIHLKTKEYLTDIAKYAAQMSW